ncbi:autotransporter assembly complex family protein [Xanthobacter autotrophicus]|uniref:autotransporter assembly complex protein TamA n=1 Tax=Xanthobacter autotrophicus TaxID=280 RepID=UPI00372B72F8
MLSAVPSHAQSDDFFGSIAALFNPNATSRQTPVIDATPYTLNMEVQGGDGGLKSAITQASNLESLKDRPPSGAAGLVRRALSDFERITAALYGEGRYGASIRITVAGMAPNAPNIFDVVERARKAGPVPVRVDVDPGPPFVFGDIRILDASTRRPLADGPSLRALGLEPGESARADRVVRAEAVLVDFWRERGHPFARLTGKDVVADHATHRLNVTLLIETGPVATFGTFTVSGADFLPPNFIEDRVEIPPGTPYSPDRLTRLRKRLLTIQAIASVRLREGERLDAQGRLPIFIEVRPRDPRYVGFSAKYSSTDGSSINGFWGHRNLFGGGETLRLDASVSWFGGVPEAVPNADPFGYKLAASFVKPGIWTAQDDLIVNAAILREVTNAYVREGVVALLAVRHRFDDQLSMQVGLDFEDGQVEDTTGTYNALVTGIPVDIFYDTTDNALDASRGIRLNATVEPFAYLGDSGAGPVMLKAALSAYHAFDDDRRIILAGRVAAGSLVGVGDLYDVPPQRRFYVGGGGSVRGYDFQSASPRNAFGQIVGGLSFFEASAEVRVRITDTIGIVPFFDMGSAFASEYPDFNGLKYAAGIGLRYYTPIGPLRLDFAVPLNPGPDDGSFGVYVSLGQAF